MSGAKSYNTRSAVGWCPEHEKLMYSTRKDARRVAKQNAKGGEHKAPYLCDVREGYWHVGALGFLVTSGFMTREERYG